MTYHLKHAIVNGDQYYYGLRLYREICKWHKQDQYHVL